MSQKMDSGLKVGVAAAQKVEGVTSPGISNQDTIATSSASVAGAQAEQKVQRSIEIAADRIYQCCLGYTSKADRQEMFRVLENLPPGSGEALRETYLKRHRLDLDEHFRQNLYEYDAIKASLILNNDRIGLASHALETAWKGGFIDKGAVVVKVNKVRELC